jgi:hypothetical protein
MHDASLRRTQYMSSFTSCLDQQPIRHRRQYKNNNYPHTHYQNDFSAEVQPLVDNYYNWKFQAGAKYPTFRDRP